MTLTLRIFILYGYDSDIIWHLWGEEGFGHCGPMVKLLPSGIMSFIPQFIAHLISNPLSVEASQIYGYFYQSEQKPYLVSAL